MRVCKTSENAFVLPRAVMRLRLPPSWYSFMLILQIQESRERIARQEREMQVRESSSLKDADSSQLLNLAIEYGAESSEGNGLDAVAVTPHYRRRHGQRVENGFFRGFDRCRNQWVQMR